MARPTIGQRLRSRRKALKMTQKQLAQLVGCTDAAITEIEKGRRLPSLPTLVRLVAVLDQLHATQPVEDGDGVERYERNVWRGLRDALDDFFPRENVDG